MQIVVQHGARSGKFLDVWIQRPRGLHCFHTPLSIIRKIVQSFSPTLPGSKRSPLEIKGDDAMLPRNPIGRIVSRLRSEKTGHSRIWRRSCNAREWMSAGICSPASSWALPKPALIFYSVFKRFFACPSSGFSQNRYKTWTRYMPSVSPTNRPLLQRNPGEKTPVANAKS